MKWACEGRGLAALLGLVLFASVTGYDLFGDDESVERVWQTQGADRVYLHVTSLRTTLMLEIVDGALNVTADGVSETFVRGDREVESFVPECPAR